jgi:membrane protein YqaA with SNARE-associated domain
MLEGYLALFVGSFLAATLLPFSSEVMLGSLAASGAFSPALLWLVASAGNVLGAVANWLLGKFFLHWKDRRWFPFRAQQLERAQRAFARYGLWTLLFSWVPVVGDPLTFAAGVLRVPFVVFFVLVAVGKAARYALLMATLDAIAN